MGQIRAKYSIIAKALLDCPELSISSLCRHAKIERSSYYYWSNNVLSRLQKDALDLERITYIFEKKKKKAGIRTITMELTRIFNIRLNPKKVARIKKEYGLITQIRRKNAYKSFANKIMEHSCKKNILKRNFSPPHPDQVYSTDITQLRFAGGRKAYLSAVKDLCTREIISHTVTSHAGLELSLSVANAALKDLSLRKRKRLIFHSDQGAHYTCRSYQHLLGKFMVTQSMSRRGNCLDNAPIESFFGHLKDELDLQDCCGIEEVKNKVAKYIDYYNNQRPQWSLKEKSPVEYRGFLLKPGFS